MLLASSPPLSLPTFRAEHTRITLPAPGPGGLLLVNGQLVPRAGNVHTTPFIEVQEGGQVTVNVHDRVGRLHFTSTDGQVDETAYVFPAKLAPDPQEAFAALGRMVDALPDLTAHLGYPTHLVPVTAGLQVQALQLADVEQVALETWRLTQVWQRAPRWTQGAGRRVVRGGTVPDRVDWNLTLDHWGRGGFPDHVARDLPQATLPPGLGPLRELWGAIATAARNLPGGTDLAARARVALGALPDRHAHTSSGRDPVSRAARALLERLDRLCRQVNGLPSGHVRMPDLYELWVQASLLRALGATDGTFGQNSQGLYVGTFRGPGVTVTLNPRLGFRGVGQVPQFLMPDLLAVFDAGPALVADVKYRDLKRAGTEQLREVNRQLLGYMGLTHAATGLVLWPAPDGEPSGEEPLPQGRARLLRVRCHPLDPPGALAARLHDLDLPGVS